MNLGDLKNLVDAGVPLIYVRSDDLLRAERKILNLFPNATRWAEVNGNPLKALEGLADGEVKILHNFHWYLDKPPLIQLVLNNLEEWRSKGICCMMLSSVVKIPSELTRECVVLEDEIPSAEEITASLRHIEVSAGLIPLEDPETKLVVEAAGGMSLSEFEDSLSLSVVEKNMISASVVYRYKVTAMERDGFLEVVKPSCTLDDLKGMTFLKDLVLSMVGSPMSKGFLLIGPGGTGKTRFMEGLCGSTGIPGIKVNTGKLMSKYQGESDQNTLQLIKRIKAFGRCIVLFDEFEKQFASASGNAETDGGTGKRVSSHWLDFLQNRPAGVFVIGSANSFRGIPAEYLRPGRWDSAPIFVGLPGNAERNAIFQYYIGKFNLKDAALSATDTEEWTGAEIESCCRLAAIRGKGLMDAKRFIIPLAKTMAEDVAALRTWAKGTCLMEEQVATTTAAPTLRKIGRK